MKKILCMGLLAAMLLVGCRTDSSVNASVSSQEPVATATSSGQQVLSSEVASEAVSSKAESVSSAASSKVTSSKVTSSEKASSKATSEKESEQTENKIVPLLMGSLINKETGESIHIGMTRKQVEKIFPLPDGVKAKKYHYYNNMLYDYNEQFALGYKNDVLNYIEYWADEPKGIYDVQFGSIENEKAFTNEKRFEKLYGKDGAFYDYIKKNGKKKILDAEYFFLKTDNGLKVMQKKDFKQLDKRTAKNMFCVCFEWGSAGLYSVQVVNYMTAVDVDWDFGSWQFED